MLLGWRAWYTEGRTFEGRTGEEFLRLPAEGVLWITLYYIDRRVHFSGGDWYVWTGDGVRYVASGAWGTWQPRPDGCLSCIKKGAGVSDEEFARVQYDAWANDNRHGDLIVYDERGVTCL